MNALKISVFIFAFSLFVSCRCDLQIIGSVIDAETRLPIDKVKVKENSRDWVIDTDSLGHFEIFSSTVGIFVYPKIVLSFEKEGYNKVIKKYRNWNDNVVIVLEKLKE